MARTDTIFALSSGHLPAAIAVIRMTGPGVVLAFETFCRGVPPPRHLVMRNLKAHDGTLIDQAMAVHFPGPRTETGEDCGEFHLHGGRAVVAAMLDHLSALPGFRHATAGEFTRRALLNGKMNLLQVEALGQLIDAETEAQRRFAIANADGCHSRIYEGWRRDLLGIRALLEADIDFSDQDDVDDLVAKRAVPDIRKLRDSIEAAMAGYRATEIIQDGLRVVIIGAPNTGKSSLLNALAGRDAAIVSQVPGTTRDLIDVSLDVDGHKVVITDTAGLREPEDEVERIGIARARAKRDGADVIVLLDDGDSTIPDMTSATARTIRVNSKADNRAVAGSAEHLSVSAVTGEGISELKSLLASLAREMAGRRSDATPFSSRHREHLHLARKHLDQALLPEALTEIQAEELRLAANELGKLIGDHDIEEVLGAIFSSFCIGK